MKQTIILATIPLVIFLGAFSEKYFESIQPGDSVKFEDFVGAEACASCHEPQFSAWKSSTHGRAGGKPDKSNVIAPFDGSPIVFRDGVVIPSVTAEGEYVFAVRQADRREKVFVVEGVIGGAHMTGGGTQGFVSRFPDGTVRFLPFDYSKSSNTWFANTNTRKNKGWVPINKELSLADCGDWPPNRILGTNDRFANCQECHGSQISITFDRIARKYQTRYSSLAINCESCHGPGKKHVELALSGKIGESESIGIRSLSILDKGASLKVCFQCHAVKDVIAPGYFSGKNLEDHYALKFPALGEQPLHPDGRVRTFSYQENHLFSDCYANGSMTCVDCHDPHSQGYRDVNRHPLTDRFNNGQCTGCHAAKLSSLEQHSRHNPDSPGSKCVNCHMPYLQHPEVGKHIRFARSDHTISIPRPAFDASLGIESACKQCHQDKSVKSLEQKTKEWYGEMKPQKPIVAGLVRAQKAKDAATAARQILLPSANFPAAQFAGLSLMFENLLHPNMTFHRSISDSLKKLAESEDFDVAGLALACLDLAYGELGPTKSFLEQFFVANGERARQVKNRWALALGYAGDKHREATLFDESILIYKKALRVTPDDARILHNIAQSYSGMQDFENAAAYCVRSIEADSSQALVFVNLAIAYSALGQTREALEIYQKATQVNPFEPLAYFNMGNVYLVQGREFSAIDSYQKAVELDPSLALGHFYLARAYLTTKQYGLALESVKRALEFDPSHSSARQMRNDLEAFLKPRK
ncbi:MAG: ammonia-forming cytochrome c nitrite reductase subunit c552 [Ignavibacteriales bacterium]|nr:ammonia-forming cytochrome c nitrite reductase subunit c552 [Ignavibacteriales bacterium]